MMIIEVTNKNIKELDNSFIPKENILEELTSNPYAKILVLKEHNKVIGYIYYSIIYERAEINQFEIETFHRNCGKGDYLLKEALKKMGSKNITLEVRKDNYAAITLYEKNGFVKRAIRPGYYEGVDGILMQKSNH